MSDLCVGSVAAVGLPPGDPVRASSRTSRRIFSALDVARRLGRQLTPVVLDLGPMQPRFASYLEWDETTETVMLSPVAGDALGVALSAITDRIRIRSADPAEAWMLTVRGIRLVDRRTAAVDLAHGVVGRLRDRIPGRTRMLGQEPLVLAVHGGTGSIEGHVFPVIGLGASHCLIDATRPLDLGDLLDPVEVIGDRRIIRRASARVIEIIPWITAHGHRRFRCRLALDTPASIGTPAAGHDLLSDPDRITRLFDLATMIGLDGWYDAPGWPRARMRMVELRHNLVILSVDDRPPDAIPLPGEVRIGFELFSISYEARVRLHRSRGGRLIVALPLVMRRCRRRREQRAQVPRSMAVTLTFRNSANGEVARRRVVDLSFGGLCFKIDVARDILWKGACLEAARLEWKGGRVALGDLEVRDIETATAGQTLCHVVNRGVAPSDNPLLINLMTSLHHPEAKRHDGADFRMMVDFYKRAGLLGEFMLRNLRPVLPVAATTWRKLHSARSTVACTLTSRRLESSPPQAAVTAVRVWERTWFAQHFGSIPTADRSVAGTLQLAYMDFVLPRPDAHYLAFFVKTSNTSMNSFYERFFELTGTPESFCRITLGLWSHPGDGSRPPTDLRPGISVRVMESADEMLVSRAAERTFGSLASRALSLVPNGFRLSDTARLFARLELQRRRNAMLITSDGLPTLALLKEETSPGVNLTWMLDAWWLLPVSTRGESHEEAVAVAAAQIVHARDDRPHEDRFVIVPDGMPTGALEAAGFTNLLSAHLYVLNRAGLRRYYEYISDRYGALDARLTKHETRMMKSAS